MRPACFLVLLVLVSGCSPLGDSQGNCRPGDPPRCNGSNVEICAETDSGGDGYFASATYNYRSTRTCSGLRPVCEPLPDDGGHNSPVCQAEALNTSCAFVPVAPKVPSFLADFTGDGRIDLLEELESIQRVRVYQNKGDGDVRASPRANSGRPGRRRRGLQRRRAC